MKEKFIVLSEEAREAVRFGGYDRKNSSSSSPGRPEFTLPPGTLSRKAYLEVKAAFETLGGKWNSKAEKFLFERDCFEELIALGETGQVVNRRQTFQEFFTPPVLAARIASTVLARKPLVISILEPSAGRGALVNAVIDARRPGRLINITAVEMQPENVAELPRCAEVSRVCADFLTWKPNIVFDAVIMNPPFSGRTWLAHVDHALAFVKHGGILLAVVPAIATCEMISVPCTIEPVDCKFEHTGVSVKLLTLVKGSTVSSKKMAAAANRVREQPLKSPAFHIRQVRKSVANVIVALDELEAELQK